MKLGQNFVKYFVPFWGNGVSGFFEIYWPLTRRFCQIFVAFIKSLNFTYKDTYICSRYEELNIRLHRILQRGLRRKTHENYMANDRRPCIVHIFFHFLLFFFLLTFMEKLCCAWAHKIPLPYFDQHSAPSALQFTYSCTDKI